MTPLETYRDLKLTAVGLEVEVTASILEKLLNQSARLGHYIIDREAPPLESVKDLPVDPLRPMSLILWEPIPHHTAILSNTADGSFFLMDKASQLTAQRWYRLSIHDSSDEIYPGCSFYADGGVGENWKHRGVQAVVADKNRWVFVNTGEPIEIEDPSHYKRRRIRDRLNREIILGYFQKLGMDLTEPSFWDTGRNSCCIRYVRNEEK